MFNGKTILAIIPARGGSKGVPYKNIRELAGKPLIAWTIEEAKKSQYIDRLILSSEDDQIIKIAKEWECEAPFVRPVELALDDTPGIAPVIHAVIKLNEKYDYVVLLQPTSPLRTVEEIDGCIKKCIKAGKNSCVSVCEVRQTPYWMYKIDKNERLQKVLTTKEEYKRRQDIPIVYIINGAVYVAKTDLVLCNKSLMDDDTIAYIMSKEKSIDIDEENDLLMVEIILRKKLGKST